MISKDTIVVLEHTAIYDYGDGLQTKLTLGELVKALEKYEKSNNNSDPGEYLAGFLKSGIVKTEKYSDSTAQCALICFSLLGQHIDVDNNWLKEHNLSINDVRDKEILSLDIDFGIMDRVGTDIEEFKSLESYKKLEDTFRSKYILDYFKEILGSYCDIQEINILGEEISIGCGDIYQDPEQFEPRNNIKRAWWIKYNSEWLKLRDNILNNKQDIINYIKSANSNEDLGNLILEII